MSTPADERGQFWVGGHYEDTPDLGPVRAGQMYVEYQRPASPSAPVPIVFVHGGGSTGVTFLRTPDGRPGWGPYFFSQGFATYVVDRPGFGRSPMVPSVYGPSYQRVTVQDMQLRNTRAAEFKLWPQARLHTQWPGEGKPGDPIFDASLDGRGINGLEDVAMEQALARDALSALLDLIGPAIVVSHSASGPIGFAIADKRPDAVRALVSLEPSGPPFHDVKQVGEDKPYEVGNVSRPWGLAAVPLTYDPPAADPSELKFVEVDQSPSPELVRGWLQAEPARRLPNLARVPILILTGEASYHAAYDHATSNYLTQAGVAHDFVRLEDRGVHGNGHSMAIEKNNVEVAEVVRGWLERKVFS